MPIELRGTPTFLASGSRTSSSIAMPSGVQPGDVVLICLGAGNSSAPTITPPASVTLVANINYLSTSPAWTVNLRVYRYTVTGSGDPSSFVFTSTSGTTDGIAVAFSGVDTSSPIDATPTVRAGADGESTTATFTALTTTVDGVRLVGIRGSWDGNAITPGGSWTEHRDQPVTWLGSQVKATAGDTGALTVPAGNGGSYPWATILVPLRPLIETVEPSEGGAVETITISDSAAGVRVAKGGAVETLTFTDAAMGMASEPDISEGGAIETITISDSATGSRLSVGGAIETLTISDVASGLRVARGAASESIEITDSAFGRRVPKGSAVETITFADLAAGATSGKPIYFAGTQIKNVYLGEQPILHRYKGGDQLW